MVAASSGQDDAEVGGIDPGSPDPSRDEASQFKGRST